jgi:hypothetical protein
MNQDGSSQDSIGEVGAGDLGEEVGAGGLGEMALEVFSSLRDTDERFWDEVEAAFAAVSSQDLPDHYFNDIDWLAYILKNDPTSAIVNVTNADRRIAKGFLGVLMFVSPKAILDASLPEKASKRLIRIARVYGPLAFRVYDRVFRASDWESIELGVSNPVGATTDPDATIKIVIRRYDGQIHTLRSRPEGVLQFARIIAGEFYEILDEEMIEQLDSEAVDDFVRIANNFKKKISGNDEES